MTDSKKKKPKRKRGRPTSFSDKMVETILELAAQGKTDTQIAKTLGIARSTLALWKGKYQDLSDALTDAKEMANDLVEAALFQRAIGYHHPAIKFFCYEGKIKSQKYTEVYAPDVGAITLWLKNRKPKEWRDVQKHEITATDEDGLPQIIVTLPANGREAK